MTPIEFIATMRAKAAAATPGPWFHQHRMTDEEAGVPGGIPDRVLALHHDPDPEGPMDFDLLDDLQAKDAAHIAACDPDTIRALLDVAEAAMAHLSVCQVDDVSRPEFDRLHDTLDRLTKLAERA